MTNKKTYTKSRISLKCDQKLKNQLSFIAQLENRDLNGQSVQILQDFVRAYIRKNKLSSNESDLTVEGQNYKLYMSIKEEK